MSEGGDNQGNSLSESMFLVLKLLRSQQGKFPQAYEALVKELDSQDSLGETYSWDGSVRKTSFAEMDVKYNRIGDDFLLRRLRQTGSSSSCTSTILEPIQCEDPSAGKGLSRALATALSNMRISSEEIRDLDKKIVHLQDNLSKQAGTVGLLDDEQVPVTEVLSAVGMTKELSFCRDKVKNVRDFCEDNRRKTAEISASMRDRSLLRGCGYAGVVSSGTDYLHQRDLGGVAGMTVGDFGPFGQGGVFGGSCGAALAFSARRAIAPLTSSYKLLWRINAHCLNPAYCVIFDRTGEYAISGADDFLVKIWHVPTGRLCNTLRGHQSYISMLVMSSDNSLIASACTYGYIRIWLFRTGRCVAVLKHSHGAINWLKFDETSLCLVSAGEEGQCMVWDISQYLLESPAAWTTGVVSVAAAPVSSRTSSEQAAMTHSQSSDSLIHSGDASVTVVATTISSTGGDGSGRGVLSSDMQLCEYQPGSVPWLDILQEEGREAYRRLKRVGVGVETSDSVAAAESTCCMHAPYEAAFLTCPWKQGEVAGVAPSSDSVSSSRGSYADFMAEARAGLGARTAGSFCLSLPHVSDGSSKHASASSSSARGEDLDATSVYCLDISPLGGFVVTGCEDGVARVWRIGSESPADTEVGLSTRSSGGNGADLAALEQLRGEIPHDEWLSLETVAKHLVCRLEGHANGVTDVRFSNRGDKVVTGSCQEGSVRIWVFSKHYCKATYIAIDLDSNALSYSAGSSSSHARGSGADDNTTSNPSYHSRRINKGPAKVAAHKPQLYNVHWTCDDMFLVTVQSAPDYRLTSRGAGSANAHAGGSRAKVFNSSTGAILHTLLVSYDRVDVLAMHPANPSVFCTAGMDGVLRVWDTSAIVYSGHCDMDCTLDPNADDEVFCDLTDALPYPPVYSFSMVCPPETGEIPEGSAIRIVDVMFSCDCHHIICTDFIGRVCLFGPQSMDSEAYADVFPEQYYSSDYADIVLDEDGWAIDVQTQLPVHLVRDSYLCRLNGSAYSTPETTDDRTQGSSDSGTLIRNGAIPPVPLPVHVVRREVGEIRAGRALAFKAMERAYHYQHKKNKTLREKTAFTGGSGINATLSGALYHNSMKPQRRGGRPPSSQSPLRSQRASQRYDESELYGGQNGGSYDENKYDYLLEDSDDVFADGGRNYRGNASSSRGAGTGAGAGAAGASRSNGDSASSPSRRSGRSTIQTLTARLASGVGSVRRSSETRTRNSSSGNGSSSSRTSRRTVLDDDDEEDEYQETAAARRRRQLLSDEESFGSFSGESEGDGNSGHSSSSDAGSASSDESEGGPHSPSRRSKQSRSSSKRHGKKGRGRPSHRKSRHVDDGSECEEFNEVIEVKQPRKPRYIPWSKRASVNAEGDVVPIGVQVDRKWLLEDAPPPPLQYTGSQQYCPQVGDSVFYFPQGHMVYLERFGGAAPWLANPLFLSHPAVVECEVASLSFHFPTEEEYAVSPSIVATIVMRVTGLPLPVPASSSQFIPTQFTVPRTTRHTATAAANNPFGQNTIVVSVRCCGLPDFIIPHHVYQRAARTKWRIGMRVSGWFSDETPSPPENVELALSQGEEPSSKEVLKMYPGTVVNISDCSVAAVAAHDRRKSSAIQWRSSPWDCMQVLWDDATSADNSVAAVAGAEGDRICPWEITPCVETDNSASGTPMGSPLHQGAGMLPAAPLEFPRLPEVAREALLRVVDQCMGTDSFARGVAAAIAAAGSASAEVEADEEPEIDEEFEYARPFWYNVDAEVYVEYYSMVPLPMCLDLIRRRLVRRYYHSVAAVMADINLLLHNCALYNEDGAEIVGHAQRLVQLLTDTVAVYDDNGTQGGILGGVAAQSPDAAQRSSSSSSGANRLGGRSIRNTPSPVAAPVAAERAGRRGAVAVVAAAPVHVPSAAASSSSSSSAYTRSRRGAAVDASAQASNITSTNDRSQAASVTATSAAAARSSLRSDRSRRRGGGGTESEEEILEMEVEDESEAEPESEESEEELSTSRKRRRGSGRSSAGNAYVEAGSRSRRRVSYQEAESEEEEEEEEEEEPARSRPARSMAERMSRAASSASGSSAATTAAATTTTAAAVAPKRLSPELKKLMLELITSMATEDADSMGLFQKAVTEDIAPGYFDIVPYPMDLTTIRSKFTGRVYTQLGELVDDFLLMYDNCELYNDPASDVVKESRRQKKMVLTWKKQHRV